MINRKRYSIVYRQLAAGVIAILGVAVCTCAPRRAIIVAPDLPARAAITERKSVVPTIEQARKDSSDNDKHVTRASEAVDRVGSGLTASKTEMNALVAEAARLVKKQSATENELAELYRRLVEESQRNTLLLQDNAIARSALTESQSLSKRLAAGLVEAEALASAKDQEVALLRDRVATLDAENKGLHKNIVKSAAAADSANHRADNLEGGSKAKTRAIIVLGVLCAIEIGIIAILLRRRVPVI